MDNVNRRERGVGGGDRNGNGGAGGQPGAGGGGVGGSDGGKGGNGAEFTKDAPKRNQLGGATDGIEKKDVPGSGSGGGGGGGGDATQANPQPGFGGKSGAGGAGGAESGENGDKLAAAGDGGAGGFILAASNGVIFSGTAFLGDGVSAVYGIFTATGQFPDSLPAIFAFSSWVSLSAQDYGLFGGAGGGGEGGDGQLYVEEFEFLSSSSAHDVLDLNSKAFDALRQALS